MENVPYIDENPSDRYLKNDLYFKEDPAYMHLINDTLSLEDERGWDGTPVVFSSGESIGSNNTIHAVESVGTDQDAFRVLYNRDAGLIVDWAAQPTTPVSKERTGIRKHLPLSIVSFAGTFALVGAADVVTGPADLNYYSLGVGVLTGSLGLALHDWRKANKQTRIQPAIEPERAITPSMIQRGSELDQAILINSNSVRLPLDHSATSDSYGSEEEKTSAEELFSLLSGRLDGFDGIHLEAQPVTNIECSCDQCRWNNSQNVIIIDPAAVLFQILRDPVTTEGHDDGVVSLLNDILDIAVAQHGLLEIEEEAKRIQELSIGSSMVAKELRKTKLEEHDTIAQPTQSAIAHRVLDCVADYLARKGETFRNTQYSDIAKLSKEVLGREVNDATPIVHAAFDEVALRVIQGLSMPDVLTPARNNSISYDMRELVSIANQAK